MKRINPISRFAGVIILCSAANFCLAQGGLGEILPDDIAQSADASVLEAEANLFNIIKNGVALSIALCEGVEQCTPSVNRAELEQIISTLDARIDNLGQRYEASGDATLEGVLVAYADARDSYTQYLEKLSTMVVEEPEEAVDLFGSGDFFGGAADMSREFEIFNDVDENLTDDVDVEEPLESESVSEGAAEGAVDE
jgi:hypothetical protein